MMQWITQPQERTMETLMVEQVATLREQMKSAAEEFADTFVNDDPDAVELRGAYAMMSRMRARRRR
jgi:hypothetical protein